MIYFTADLHLGHANIIKLCNRPFGDVDQMNETLINNWNARVQQQDEIYILGDFTMQPLEKASGYLSRLNGRKYFIRGNHDGFLHQLSSGSNGIEWVKDYHVLKHEGRKIILFHYPIYEWDGYYRNTIHLFGHVHDKAITDTITAARGLAFCVGVDCHNFAPVSLQEVLDLATLATAANDDKV